MENEIQSVEPVSTEEPNQSTTETGEETFESFLESFTEESDVAIEDGEDDEPSAEEDVLVEDDEVTSEVAPEPDPDFDRLKAAYENKLAEMANAEHTAQAQAERQRALELREQGQPLAGLPEEVSGYISTNFASEIEAVVTKAESVYKKSMADALLPLMDRARNEGLSADELESGLVDFVNTFVGHITSDLASQSIKTAVKVGEDIHTRTNESVRNKAALEIESKQLEQAFVENLNSRGITNQESVAKVVQKVNLLVSSGLHPKVAVESVFDAMDMGKESALPAVKDELAAKRLANKHGNVGQGSVSQSKKWDYSTDPNTWSEAQLDSYMKKNSNKSWSR